MSFTAWNAVIFADVLNDHRYLDEIRRLTPDKPETARFMEQPIARKRALFADGESSQAQHDEGSSRQARSHGK